MHRKSFQCLCFNPSDLYTPLMALCSTTINHQQNIIDCATSLLEAGANVNAHDRLEFFTYFSKFDILCLITPSISQNQSFLTMVLIPIYSKSLYYDPLTVSQSSRYPKAALALAIESFIHSKCFLAFFQSQYCEGLSHRFKVFVTSWILNRNVIVYFMSCH